MDSNLWRRVVCSTFSAVSVVSAFSAPARAQSDPAEFILAAIGRHNIVFVGDIHPIAEPKLILAEVIARQDPATAIDVLALEVGSDQQPTIDRYLAGVPEDTSLLTSNPRTLRSHWGASREYLDIYRAAYAWNQSHRERPLRVVAADVRSWPIAPLTEMMAAGGFANRDEWMARAFLSLIRAHPEWRILVFMGGYHGLETGGGEVTVGKARARFDLWFCGWLRDGGIDPYTILMDARQDDGLGATRVFEAIARPGTNVAVTLGVATDSIREPMRAVETEGYRLAFLPARFPLRLAVDAMVTLDRTTELTPIN
jgi:hypothetical protein